MRNWLSSSKEEDEDDRDRGKAMGECKGRLGDTGDTVAGVLENGGSRSWAAILTPDMDIVHVCPSRKSSHLVCVVPSGSLCLSVP
jgi:hypothetical protein